MESILAKALEYTLKYWLKSFARDQFKLQGRTAQLSNLDIDGDSLHASLGLPTALSVTSAKVGKLEISLPSVSNVHAEPIVVQIDKLDLVIEENPDQDANSNASSPRSTASSGKSSGYGFADKIADGMTIEVQTVNLLLETRGASCHRGGSTWKPPMASITMHNLLLYTTNENWEVVNLKEARNYSNDKNFIYVFRKLRWKSLAIDLLPHPDMFTDSRAQEGPNKRDDDGAKRVFFGGERFLEGISGEANITIQRTELNDPLGLEVSLHISEAVCPALSEPGLRAFLRFLTGLYVCLNRGDVDPASQQGSIEAAGRSLVSIIVDHVFLCIKDAEFRLELLMQSLFFSRACISDGESAKILTKIMIGGLFLRDTIFQPPCTLIQPSMGGLAKDSQLQIPEFAKDFSPPIYPLGDQHWLANKDSPFMSFHCLQVKPSPTPLLFASQTVIDCQPLMIHLQEESCLRISSFIADGLVVGSGSVLPDSSVNSFMLTLQGLDLTAPLDIGKLNDLAGSENYAFRNLFSEARIHIENLFLFESPSLKLSLLQLEKDPACLCLWDDQPIDGSQKKWSAGASYFSLSLETSNDTNGQQNSSDKRSGLWNCAEIKDTCIEVAMATPDGSPLVCFPPPGGIVRVGIACEQFLFNASVKQLFFVLDLYAFFEKVYEKIALVEKNSTLTIQQSEPWNDNMICKVPSDTAVSFTVKDLQLRFVEDLCKITQGKPLVQFIGDDLFIKVGHRTLGGAVAISSTIWWDAVEVDCVDAEQNNADRNGALLSSCTNDSLLTANGCPELRTVLWIQHKGKKRSSGSRSEIPFLDVNITHVIPSQAQHAGCHSLNVSACVAGVRLGGGMNHTEALLHRFGIFGPDGGPSEGLLKGLENLSAGPLSKLLEASPLAMDDMKSNGNCEDNNSFLSHLETPDDVDVSVDLRNWLFALEGAQEMAGNLGFDNHVNANREDRSWHTTFKSLKIKATNSPKDKLSGAINSHSAEKRPVELIRVGVEGLQTLKPQVETSPCQADLTANRVREGDIKEAGGIDFEVWLVSDDDALGNWMLENLKFSVQQPIEAVVTKKELQHLALLCKSEINSMGRITAGVLRILKLEATIGQTAIDQLSNLGTEGLNKFFSSSVLSRRGNGVSFDNSLSPAKATGSTLSLVNTAVASLEKEVGDAESKCNALITEFGKSKTSSQHLHFVKDIGEQFGNIRNLLKQLKPQD